MKRALIIVLVSTCLLGLVGCDPGMTTIDGDELLKNTVKIELYNYENTSPKLYELNSEKLPIFDFSKATFIAELDKSHFEDVIKDIAKQECLVFGNALNEPIGKTMILYQENGNMVVLFSCVYKNGKKLTRYYGECNVFDENGMFIEHIGRIGSDYVDTLEANYFGSIT
jgi:hypothetical protein